MLSSDTIRHVQSARSDNPHKDCSPWLSVLIPAYEYSAGVDRILEALASQQPVGVECIVRDDSLSDEVQQVVEARIRRQEVTTLTYVRSQDQNGAVDNWNALLAMAKGEYILLMHHDEAPLGPDFFAALRSELFADGDTDVLLLGCLVGLEYGSHLRCHMPAAVQSFLLRVMGSAYLLRRNFAGPPSVFVVRRSACLPFDNKLKWLVDVDWMNRCMRPKNLRSKVSRRCLVASLQRTGASITSTLGNQVREIERTELKQICAEQHLGRWAELLQPRSVWNRFIASLELALWVALKVVIRLVTLIARPSNPFSASDTEG